ncbi:unnamed protein product [Ilex paraguariensis]|uniref:Uncharacterized protein n=1 Tax=Ilex paraguariensis TaxID=185542 RepID=A0ABC8R609_9AQUA
MLENPSTHSLSSAANIATIKPYAHPNQRNRSLSRRKSGGDRLERANIYANDGEKNQNAGSKNLPIVYHGNEGGNNRVNVDVAPRLIPLHGCCNSEAFQLLNDRWIAGMDAYNNPSIDLAGGLGSKMLMDIAKGHASVPTIFICLCSSPSSGSLPKRPVLYTGSGTSAWGIVRLPHQMDFLSELRHAMRDANASSDT